MLFVKREECGVLRTGDINEISNHRSQWCLADWSKVQKEMILMLFRESVFTPWLLAEGHRKLIRCDKDRYGNSSLLEGQKLIGESGEKNFNFDVMPVTQRLLKSVCVFVFNL